VWVSAAANTKKIKQIGTSRPPLPRLVSSVSLTCSSECCEGLAPKQMSSRSRYSSKFRTSSSGSVLLFQITETISMIFRSPPFFSPMSRHNSSFCLAVALPATELASSTINERRLLALAATSAILLEADSHVPCSGPYIVIETCEATDS